MPNLEKNICIQFHVTVNTENLVFFVGKRTSLAKIKYKVTDELKVEKKYKLKRKIQEERKLF